MDKCIGQGNTQSGSVLFTWIRVLRTSFLKSNLKKGKMLMKQIVSVVTPCYNSENYIRPFLQSLLNQTYLELEIILVDDGSTDSTAEIIEEHRPDFEKTGVTYHYIYQEHENQARAVNTGLKYVTGTYLIWPDSDDILEPTSVEKRVEYLQNHPEEGMVRSDRYYINAATGKRYEGKVDAFKHKKDLFFELFFEKCNVCCGTYMIRMSCFDKINPEREIVIGHGGQNYQMLLPMVYHFLCGYVDEPLYGVVVHGDSHSQQERTYAQARDRMDSLLMICASVLQDLPLDERTKRILMKMKRNHCYQILDDRYGYHYRYLLRVLLRKYYSMRYRRIWEN